MSSIIKRLEIPAEQGGSRILDSPDLRSTPLDKRTWNKRFFSLFWLAAVTNVSNWSAASSFLALGVTPFEGLGCSCAGFALVSLWMIACGRPGAKWAVPFPICCRSSFGVFGAAWPALNRAFMSMVWQSINAVSGAQALYITLHAVFPSFSRIPKNTMGPNSALTSAQMICFFLFLGLNASMLTLGVHKWHRIVYIKLVVFAISTAGMLALVITKAGGGVGTVLTAPSKVHGSEHAWLLVRMILTSAASCSTFASNASDWQRNSTRPNDPILGQLLGFPLSNLFVNAMGLISASCSEVIYGEVIWLPTAFLARLLEDNYDAKHRAAAFFISTGFLYSLLFSCLVENIYPCGNDLAALLPRFISVKRGFYICIAASCLLNPWYLLGSASMFITVLSSYQIFLFSICGILITDYFLVAKGFFIYEDLYTRRKDGAYWYSCGCNWRAFVAYFVGVGVNFAGFLQNLGVFSNLRLAHSYYFAIFTSTFGAGATYYVLTRLCPQPNARDTWSEPKGVWVPPECQMGAVQVDGEDAVSEDKEKEDGSADVVEVPRYELRG
ncbi:uncharacterized protein RHOBADRAFT_17169 [Rhodotorula graminis WP1]|uniref:Uncharacterized protein n=1 Tax=Rhodotorula graminis (strain WP1) TaxID=578459 RepID=A0A0P9H0J8_RHOGW|nr:uncharacterized protein RHOBADRAFT_17169 [Rhodotorula graminis WP1]KPV73361.1 hypothetical protein RHOBADRAFT_17169 [Rhodotorula graminis WP1]